MGGGGGQGVTGKDRYRHHVGISRGVGECTVVVFLLPLLALAAYPRLPLLPTRRPALCISEMSSALAPATARWGREGVWKEVWKDGQLIISHSSDGGRGQMYEGDELCHVSPSQSLHLVVFTHSSPALLPNPHTNTAGPKYDQRSGSGDNSGGPLHRSAGGFRVEKYVCVVKLLPICFKLWPFKSKPLNPHYKKLHLNAPLGHLR